MITLENVSKRFGGVQALDGVSLEVRSGTIHAFVGENGAGKSTLGKIISGTHAPDSGRVLLDGRPVVFGSPRGAIGHGISTIQQEIALVPKRSVLENVFLGREPSRFGIAQHRRMRAEYNDLDAATGFGIDPGARVETLRIADQQKVEVLRAIARRSRLIVFDEPTAALTPDETASLLAVMRSLRQEGVAMVFVSHFLDEVLSIADDITILRNGSLISTSPATTQTPSSLVTSMLGRSQEAAFPERPVSDGRIGDVILAVDGLTRHGVLDNVGFSARAGEIVGVAGLVGSGRSELLRAIFGADELDSGTVTLLDQPRASLTPARSIRAGLGMIPEDRKGQGLLLTRGSAENLSLGSLSSVSTLGIVRSASERGLYASFVERLGIRPENSGDLPVGLLSGGNQQKVLLAKGLAPNPRVLLIDEPTRGVDVGAKYSIYQALFELAESGLTLVIVSSEIEEILGLADRVLVMRRGRLVLDRGIDGLEQDTIMHAAFGATSTENEQGSPSE